MSIIRKSPLLWVAIAGVFIVWQVAPLLTIQVLWISEADAQLQALLPKALQTYDDQAATAGRILGGFLPKGTILEGQDKTNVADLNGSFVSMRNSSELPLEATQSHNTTFSDDPLIDLNEVTESVNNRSELPVMATQSANLTISANLHDNTTLTDYPRLWLHVDSIAEGLANWRIGFIELLLTAKKFKAALVEPCIIRGAVKSCHLLSADEGKIRVGEVFDLDKLRREVYPWIVSQENYEAATASIDPKNVFVFCMHNGSPPIASVCTRDGRLLRNYYGTSSNDMMVAALETSEQAVMDIQKYRKRGFTESKLREEDKNMIVRPLMVKKVMAESLVYHPSHLGVARGLLKQLGIDEGPYNVIHWRAELPATDYSKCVDKLIQAKEIMANHSNTFPTILISSLNEDAALQWGGSDHHTRPVNSSLALAPLWTNGFLKLDMIKDKPGTPDIIFLAIWDQLLGRNASNFATCTKSCPNSHACSACNYRGSFGRVVMDERRKNGQESHTCWPTSASEVA